MNRNRLLFAPLLLLAALIAASCGPSKNSAQSTPTPSAAPATADPYEGVDSVIKGFALHNAAPTIKDVTITYRVDYTDSSGVNWVGATVCPVPKDDVDCAFGIMKREPGGEWQLYSLGSGYASGTLPPDVRKGLNLAD
ncbi:MAG: hypothetical protein ABSC13_02390 [Dehalococcoidia bacterium]|jgi:hypothetical protein